MSALALAPNPGADHANGAPQDGVLSLLRMAVGSDVLSVPISNVREILQVSHIAVEGEKLTVDV